MIHPPPIQAPFRQDSTGRIISPVWINWLQNLSSSFDIEELFSGVQNFQTTATTTTDQTLVTIEDDDTEFHLATPTTESSTNPNDAEMLCWMSF